MSKRIQAYLSVLPAVIILLMIMAPVAQADSETTPPFDKLFVSYWPEYDHIDPNESVLVIYWGKLPDDVQLPAKINVHIPRNSKVYAATTIDPSGKLLTLPYDQEPAGDFDELTYEINHPEFQLEIYHYPTGEGTNRTYDFDFRTSTPVKELGFEIQKPQTATDFTVEPASANVNIEKRQNNPNRSFEYHSYVFRDAPKDKDYNFKVAYNKPDTNPSVNSQAATASGTAVAENRSSGVLVAFLSIGLVMVIAGIAVTIRARSLAGNPVDTQSTASKYAKPSNELKGKFCSSCGTKIEASDKFCSECGSTN